MEDSLNNEEGKALLFRYATREDLPAIVALLADDEKGKTREQYCDPLPSAYSDAFDAMESQSTDCIAQSVSSVL
ncbi:hypothetical protein [Kushneria avicenniae]|uniref:hypothetical protein n=1 Tax=Kushneria avicenniae TaxID=402385 RepID=UPI000A3DD474|nr:hypothetical protein [Kushneria avicenniae]